MSAYVVFVPERHGESEKPKRPIKIGKRVVREKGYLWEDVV